MQGVKNKCKKDGNNIKISLTKISFCGIILLHTKHTKNMKQTITITRTLPAMFAGVYVSEISACLADAWKAARNASL